MNSAPNRVLQEWIRKRKADLTPDGTITRIELWHAIDGEAGEKLEAFEMADRPEDEDPDELCQEIWNAAEENAATFPQGSLQRYAVMAFRGEDREPDQSKMFVVQGRLVHALLGGGSEPPTPRGVLTQEMRQNDNLHAMVIRLCESTAGGLARDNQTLRDDNNRLWQERRQFFELEQRLLDRQHERDQQREERAKNGQRFDALLQMGMGLLPMVAARFLGAGAQLPGMAPPATKHAAVARDTAIKNVLETLAPAQLEKIFGALSPEQSMAFMDVYNSYREEQERAGSTEEDDNVQEEAH